MLILARNIGEALIIGDDVKVTILGVKGNQIKIGVDAPKNVTVHREEVYERVLEERAEAEENEQQPEVNGNTKFQP